jgi:hypothetical protein
MIETPSSSGRGASARPVCKSSLYERLWFHTVVASPSYLLLRQITFGGWCVEPFFLRLGQRRTHLCLIAGLIERRAVG